MKLRVLSTVLTAITVAYFTGYLAVRVLHALVHQESFQVVELELSAEGYFSEDGSYHSYPQYTLDFVRSIGEGSALTEDSEFSVFLASFFYPLTVLEISFHSAFDPMGI